MPTTPKRAALSPAETICVLAQVYDHYGLDRSPRGDLLEKRRRLMADWAAWCARPVPSGATVTSIAGGRSNA
jgi:hypothetical protein